MITDLLQFPVLDFQDQVSRPDEAAVVGDDDEGGLTLGLEAAENLVDLVAGAGVEFAGRFVGEYDDRIFDQGSGDGDALLFSA